MQFISRHEIGTKEEMWSVKIYNFNLLKFTLHLLLSLIKYTLYRPFGTFLCRINQAFFPHLIPSFKKFTYIFNNNNNNTVSKNEWNTVYDSKYMHLVSREKILFTLLHFQLKLVEKICFATFTSIFAYTNKYSLCIFCCSLTLENLQ